LATTYQKGLKGNYVPTTSIYSATDSFVNPDATVDASAQSHVYKYRSPTPLIRTQLYHRPQNWQCALHACGRSPEPN
jgi:hypothetical protein